MRRGDSLSVNGNKLPVELNKINPHVCPVSGAEHVTLPSSPYRILQMCPSAFLSLAAAETSHLDVLLDVLQHIQGRVPRRLRFYRVCAALCGG
jgi:hypothetical protein